MEFFSAQLVLTPPIKISLHKKSIRYAVAVVVVAVVANNKISNINVENNNTAATAN